ncbi:MAG: histidinol phosphate phosphatase domain-containing protein [Candidatus Saganbacteria bacterium]|nr:histidinol phosphate phosphatase domain-containing protein [Candidatus Saganbacteria bacterium]
MHSIFSDGLLLPAAIVREAEVRGASTIAITDHVDASNIEFAIQAITKFIREMEGKLPIRVLPGAEVSYLTPDLILEYCKKARHLGAKIIVVHGESPIESVYPGTNHAAVSEKGVVDILAHPGDITEEDVKLAAKNGIFLELTARTGHKQGNTHVAKLAKKYGAKLLVNTDSHSEKDMITQEQAYRIAKEAGLSDKDALITIKDNPQELIKRLI